MRNPAKSFFKFAKNWLKELSFNYNYFLVFLVSLMGLLALIAGELSFIIISINWDSAQSITQIFTGAINISTEAPLDKFIFALFFLLSFILSAFFLGVAFTEYTKAGYGEYEAKSLWRIKLKTRFVYTLKFWAAIFVNVLVVLIILNIFVAIVLALLCGLFTFAAMAVSLITSTGFRPEILVLPTIITGLIGAYLYFIFFTGSMISVTRVAVFGTLKEELKIFHSIYLGRKYLPKFAPYLLMLFVFMLGNLTLSHVIAPIPHSSMSLMFYVIEIFWLGFQVFMLYMYVPRQLGRMLRKVVMLENTELERELEREAQEKISVEDKSENKKKSIRLFPIKLSIRLPKFRKTKS